MNSGGSNIHKTPALSNEIKVMVIDHKQDYLASVCDFLKYYSFEVTSVHQAGAALRLLTEKKDIYDLLLIDSYLRDVDVITFLRVTKNMDILSIVMCQEEIDDNFVLEVLRNGGFRVVKTPLTHDVIMHARQDIIRARFRKSEQFKMVDESETRTPESGDHQGRRKRAKRRSASGSGELKKKNWVEWTEELHSKFLKAIHELGDGKCFPKTILDIMNVPGLKRLQVASHLQKYRHDARKMLQGTATFSSSNKNISSNRSKEAEFKVYGSLPCIATHVQNHDQISDKGKSSADNQSITDSSVNENIFENQKDMYYAPTDYDHNSCPTNQVSDDFFDFPNDVNENLSLACMELNELNWNYDNISQQILSHDDQVMPAQGTSEFNQNI